MKLAIPLIVALVYVPSQGWAAPILGTAEAFAVLAGSTVTNTGATTINGDLGLYPGTSYTGSATVTQTGTVHLTDGVAQQAQVDNTTAYNALAGLSPSGVLTGQDLGGQTLTSGVYFFASSAQLTGALVLDAQNDANAFWVFQIGSTLTTGSASSVSFINSPGGNNALYWQVGSSAILGTSTLFQGNILALESITLNTTATIGCGSALAQNAAVTMDTNTISTDCIDGVDREQLEFGPGGVVTGPDGGVLPTIPEPGTLLLFGFGLAGLFASRKRLFPVA